MTKNVVLGLGGTVDYEISWDSTVVEELVVRYSIDAAELSRSIPVVSERDLVVTLLAFMQDGVGGERFISSSDAVESFASRFEKRVTLGGTCVRAGLAMAKLGISSTVHLVSINDHVRRLLPEECSHICSASQDSTDPHLIVQFGHGDRVRAGSIDLKAPHANRVIFTNDPPNTAMVLSDRLGTVLESAGLFLISGLNVIKDKSVLDQRLRELRQLFTHLPADSKVIYEDAGFHIPVFGERVRDVMADIVDVYSMNEDEMQSHLGRSLDLLDVCGMDAALSDLRAVIPAKTIVIHTKYWSLAMGPEAADYGQGLQGGITMASTRFCHGDAFTVEDHRAVGQLPVNSAGAAFSKAIEQRLYNAVRCIPALALDPADATTIGLGDSFVGGFIATLATST
jgi:ADP-dependent phosphofructokinase/glucokinase